MNRRLGRFYQRLVPVLRRRVHDHSEEQCEEIQRLIDTAQEHLDLAQDVREVAVKMVEMLLLTEVEKMSDLFDVMSAWKDVLERAVKWMEEVLQKCSFTLDKLTLEDQ